MYKLNDVSLVVPARDNKKYFKWMYDSIRKNIGNEIKICAADDNSSDGTKDMFKKLSKEDTNFSFIVNETGQRKGHTILFDQIIEELVKTPIAVIAHADMYWTKDSIDNMLKHMKEKTIVSATRIEPFLHPAGKEKLQFEMGNEPENFKEKEFNNYVEKMKLNNKNKITKGVFAPWMFWVLDFNEINGHDPLYRPQSREDDDIWNRFILNGIKFIQSWDSYVGHLTCRGSRYNPKITTVGQESQEWLIQNRKSERNFIRKWGFLPHHTPEHFPIISHKYDISFIVHNCNPHLLEILEPWCSRIYCDRNVSAIQYVRKEQKNTMYDLNKRVLSIDPYKNFGSNHEKPIGDIIVEFDANILSQEHFSNFIINMPAIFDQGIDIGKYQYGIFNIEVNKVKHYENDLIVVDKSKTIR